MRVLNQKVNEWYSLYNGDSIKVLEGIPDDSVHYSLFSPPFASLYTYSNSNRDMGNSRGDDEFYHHFEYLIQELYRVTMPGRLLSFHCMDLPAMKSRDGYIGVKDFPGKLIRTFEDFGFIYHSRVTVWKDPLVEATRTHALGLLHKQIVKDSAMCRQGLPDYIITMRKPGDNPEMINHPDGFTTFYGDHEPEGEKTEQEKPDDEAVEKHEKYNNNPVYSHQVWRRYASPVWMDIRQSNTLNRTDARDEKDERHICPLQLDVIARCLELWTNPGDIVLDPFAGIGSTNYVALRMDRRTVGVELKESYYEQAVINCERALGEDIIEDGRKL
ncbi:DNA modification methylase [Eubacterium aggregans]|uniref:Methyltransferase n=1 Tax=Eubacterium aggregans TaxID=81409 RepID=A0A1H3Y1K0_9FIRM|nr:site-specific DNA-methyltransferase [Eubacterium aggregans]SEA05400.1 DNA modification methylase [Eubacterium aggregans]